MRTEFTSVGFKFDADTIERLHRLVAAYSEAKGMAVSKTQVIKFALELAEQRLYLLPKKGKL